MYEIIKRLADASGESISTVEKTCGIANGTIRKWKDSKPYAETLQKVAVHFGKPIEYFLEGGKK